MSIKEAVAQSFIRAADRFEIFRTEFEKTEIGSYTKGQLTARKAGFDSIYGEVEKARDHAFEPEIKSEGSTLESIETRFTKIQSDYYDILGNIFDQLETFNDHGGSGSGNLDMSALNQSIMQSLNQNQSPSVKLTPVEIPKFCGEYNQWRSFRDIFVSVIDKNAKLTKVQKLYYLNMNLEGEPKRLIQKLPMEDNSYDTAWGLLIKQYENKRLLVDTQLKSLLSLNAAKSDTAVEIRKIQEGVNNTIAALQNLNVEVSNWDPLINYIVTEKLTPESHALWESTLQDSTDLASWEQLDKFLTGRCRTLAVLDAKKPNVTNHKTQIVKPKSSLKSFATNVNKSSALCGICHKEQHPIKNCEKFLKMSQTERKEIVRNKNLCYSCLGPHKVKDCKSKFKCNVCNGKHNSLLHYNPVDLNAKSINKVYDSDKNEATCSFMSEPATKTLNSNFSSKNNNVMLATALVDIKAHDMLYKLRALIDPGSEGSFILEESLNKLGIKPTYTKSSIMGIGCEAQLTSCASVYLTMATKYPVTTISFEAYVLKRLTGALPSKNMNIKSTDLPREIKLADPLFFKSSQIDLILGVDIYPKILLDGVIKISPTLIAQNTTFGYILSGSWTEVSEYAKTIKAFIASVSNQTLNENIKRFWELENVTTEKILTKQEKYCEEHFSKTHVRREDGRYVVELPFHQDYPLKIGLGASRDLALKRFSRTETKLSKQGDYKEKYHTVLQEYLDLGHMIEVKPVEKRIALCDTINFESYYLPHHGVMKSESLSTKLRVVFDGSALTTNGISLNQILLPGPTLHTDLFQVINRARLYPYMYTTDIKMMFRQIFVADKHTDFQRILYRKDINEDIKDYKLLTVTFGLTCAPYLAIRVLRQLACDEKQNYPLAAKIIENEVYVDDILTGAFTVDEAKASQRQLIEMLESAGFQLRKWASNKMELLEDIPKEFRINDDFTNFTENCLLKTLGILWNNKDDYFVFHAPTAQILEPLTKRKLFSEILKLFDPQGWLGPVVVRAKILMQAVWIEGTEWDDEVLPEHKKEWIKIVEDLGNIKDIRIPRWLKYTPKTTVEIHGFSDSSEKAYCACVYLRVKRGSEIFTNLITSKTKVSPIKTLSLPKLELCGAVLLIKLMESVLSHLKFEKVEKYAWSDSTIVLAWIKSLPRRWNTFVAHRVSTIQEKGENVIWKYVPTDLNPADIGSRGLSALELKDAELWWHGPRYLRSSKESWPKLNTEAKTDEEEKPIKNFQISIIEPTILARFSDLSRAYRVLAYCLRFVNKCRKISIPNSNYITIDEMENVEHRLIREEQKFYFSKDYECLLTKVPLAKDSKLLSLNPFLDDSKIMRINSRLSNLPVRFEEKYLIILPKESHLTYLIIKNWHRTSVHGNLQLMLLLLRKQFWIPKARQIISKFIHSCRRCLVERKEGLSQIMAPLPPERIMKNLLFHNVGLDFGGPITLKLHNGRCRKYTRGYICLFICFTTKAIHLEAVSDLTSKKFLDAFERFYSRRGLCKTIYTDNGRNFIGASNHLNRDYNRAIKQATEEAAAIYSSRKVEFRFNCPLASHMCGLAESGIKSVKFHLKRVLGREALTFEDLSTVLCRIEACLNSRPLVPLSDSPDDLQALTPGHFLCGNALLAPPEPTCDVLNINEMKLLNTLNKIKLDFWNQWQAGYLQRLHQRSKWKTESPNIKVNDLVILKDENTPPQTWNLGRITNTFPGKDGKVRVVELKTAKGTYKRPITKLCPLPYSCEAENSSSYDPGQAPKNVPVEELKTAKGTYKRSINKLCALPYSYEAENSSIF